jgi:hypothetical protein
MKSTHVPEPLPPIAGCVIPTVAAVVDPGVTPNTPERGSHAATLLQRSLMRKRGAIRGLSHEVCPPQR